MNRRAFLKLLGAATTGAVLDPERLLWIPRQMIAMPGPMEVSFDWTDPQLNTFISPEWVSRQVLIMLQKQLLFTTQIERLYDQQFIDATLSIRKPQRWKP